MGAHLERRVQRRPRAPSTARKWSFDTGGGGWGNNELEYYTNRADNVIVDGNGNLEIIARQEAYMGCELHLGPHQHLGQVLAGLRPLRSAHPDPARAGHLARRSGCSATTSARPAGRMCGEIDIMETVSDCAQGQPRQRARPRLLGRQSADRHVHAAVGRALPTTTTSTRSSGSPTSSAATSTTTLYETRTPADVPAGDAGSTITRSSSSSTSPSAATGPAHPTARRVSRRRCKVDYVRVYRKR